jgi:hypothetical protein
VVSPLKALMSDQISELQRKKLPGTFITSDLDWEEKSARYELLANGAFKFLYVAPERFAVRDKSEVERLMSMRPNLLSSMRLTASLDYDFTPCGKEGRHRNRHAFWCATVARVVALCRLCQRTGLDLRSLT